MTDTLVTLCGATNPDYPGEYTCTMPAGHEPAVLDGQTYDHASPEAGALWNLPTPTANVAGPVDLYDVYDRHRLARMAGEDADGGNGWDAAKRNAVIRSWQDVAPLHDELLRTRAMLATAQERIAHLRSPRGGTWEPGRYWRAVGPDGRVRCETSNEAEVRESMRPGDTLHRLWSLNGAEWRAA